MSLPIDFYSKYLPILNEENIQIRMIGEREGLPKATLNSIDRAAAETANNTGMILNFAMNYGGRRDILLAVQELAKVAKIWRKLQKKNFLLIYRQQFYLKIYGILI